MMLLALAIVASVFASVVAAPVARRTVRAVAPASAVVVLSLSSVVVAMGTGLSLCAVAAGYLAGWGPIARSGHVSTTVLDQLAPVPGWVGVTAAAVVIVLLGRSVLRFGQIVAGLVLAERFCRRLPPTGSVAYVDDPDAFTVAGLRGRVVLGIPLLAALEPGDRAVVRAHEESHLRRRHHIYVQLVEIAAAANPLLRGVREPIRFAVERWADEDAAAVHQDREFVACALARVALERQRLRASSLLPPGSVAMAAGHVAGRVQALLDPAPPRQVRRPATLAGVALSVALLAVAGMWWVNHAVEIAQAWH